MNYVGKIFFISPIMTCLEWVLFPYFQSKTAAIIKLFPPRPLQHTHQKQKKVFLNRKTRLLNRVEIRSEQLFEKVQSSRVDPSESVFPLSFAASQTLLSLLPGTAGCGLYSDYQRPGFVSLKIILFQHLESFETESNYRQASETKT